VRKVVARFRSVDSQKREVFGPVAVPLPRFFPGDVVTRADIDAYRESGALHYDNCAWTAEAVEQLAHLYLVQSREVDIEHDHQPGCGLVLESAIFPELGGAWAVRTKVLDDAAWQIVENSPDSAGYSISMYDLESQVEVQVQESDGTTTPLTITYMERPTPFELSITATPATGLAMYSIMRSRGRSATDLPIAGEDEPWDQVGAVKRLRAWATDKVVIDGEERETVNWQKFGQAFFFVDPANVDSLEGYVLPFADVVDGVLTANPQAIITAAGVLEGKMGGIEIPPEELELVKTRVVLWLRKCDRVAPWENINTDTERSMKTKIEVTPEQAGVLKSLFQSLFGRNRSEEQQPETIEVPTFAGKWAAKTYDQNISEAGWTLRDVMYDIIANEKITDKVTPILAAIDEYKALVASMLTAMNNAEAGASAGIILVETNRSIPEIVGRIERTCQMKKTDRAADVAAISAKVLETTKALDEVLATIDAQVEDADDDDSANEDPNVPVIAELKGQLEKTKADMATMLAELEAMKKPPEEPAAELADKEMADLRAQIAALNEQNKSLKESIEKVRSARPAPQAGGDDLTSGGQAATKEPVKRAHPLAKHFHVVIDDGSSGE